MNAREIIYQYDGSFNGFLCCVFESYSKKEIPTAFFSVEDDCLCLFEVRSIITDPAHAKRVYRSFAKISPKVGPFLQRVFLTDLTEKELALYRFIVKLYQQGAPLLNALFDETYAPLLKAVRHLSGEAEKLRGFLRFSDFGGILGAEIEPKNRILQVLRPHFCQRFHDESFFIYDRTHHEALLYADGVSRIVPLEHFQMAQPDEAEAAYRRLWKRFYDTIAIRERENPRCQRTNLPLRYRSTMTEFQSESFFKPRFAISPADAKEPVFPDVKPAPATRAKSEPPAAASNP